MDQEADSEGDGEVTGGLGAYWESGLGWSDGVRKERRALTNCIFFFFGGARRLEDGKERVPVAMWVSLLSFWSLCYGTVKLTRGERIRISIIAIPRNAAVKNSRD